MAATIGGAPTVRELRISLRDTSNETTTVVLALKGDTTDSQIQTLIDNYALLTNAYVGAAVLDRFEVTGIGNSAKPANEPESLVAAILALDFQKANPLNAAKSISKQVLLPAYISAIRNDGVTPHVPVTGNTDLNAITALLASKLDYVAIDDTHYAGGWSFNPGSKFGTKATVTDGL